MSATTERQDATQYDPDQFLQDLRTAAAAIDAPFDETAVRTTLEVFDAEFRRCVVQMKATCQPDSGVYYRFFYKWERDLTALAQQRGLLPNEHSPINDLQQQVLEHFPGATRAGLDFDTSFGLAKVWTFTGGPTPLDALLELPAIPESVRRHRPFFDRHGLRHVFFVASDVQQDSMNVYFGLEEDCRSEAWLRQLGDETGGTPDNANVYEQMVSSLAVSAGVGTTFRWDDDAMGRWCLYGLNLPCEHPAPEVNLPPLPERLQRFQRAAPTLNALPQYNAAWSFGKAGFYTKLEKSYAKDADFFLTHEMGGNLTRPTLT
ncbi:MAG: hypothetical protein CL681_26685 [Blastopirellula sp.]|nr:hypothetical protein [Blastopirellula sp.]